MSDVSDNREKSRFELEEAGAFAFADYRRDGAVLAIRYVEAPPILRGTGAAGRLMLGVMEIARAEGRKVLPLCGYASAWIRRHPEWHDFRA
jgi:predicted GNAT family acetyltransferase